MGFSERLQQLVSKLSDIDAMPDDEWGDKSIMRCETMCAIWTVRYQMAQIAEIEAETDAQAKKAAREIEAASRHQREWEKAKATAIEKRKMQNIAKARKLIDEVRGSRSNFDAIK